MRKLAPLATLFCSLVLFGCNSSEDVAATEAVKMPALASAIVLVSDEASKASAQSRQATTPEAAATAKQVQPIDLLKDPAELTRFEVPSQALPVWYKARGKRPALILYSNDPFLQRTSPTIQKNLLAALQQERQDLLGFARPDAVLFPEMTLDVALQSGFFSAVYWLMPVTAEKPELSIDIFRKQLIDMGALTEAEARSFTLRDGVFSGNVRDVPFHALHPQSRIDVKEPVVLHFDLGYLAPLYEKEMRTPLFPLLYSTMQHLRDQQLRSHSTTFSYSQINGKVPLGSRFVADVIEQLFLQPELLDKPIQEDWTHIANAMYLTEMLNVGMAYDIYTRLSAQSPQKASLHYALYQASRQSSSTQQNALKHLAQAVQLDAAYAYEYLQLAPLALQRGEPKAAVQMLSLAHDAVPQNPFIALELARAYLSTKHSQLAAPLLLQIGEYNWSETLYPDLKDYLQQLLNEASSGSNPGQ